VLATLISFMFFALSFHAQPFNTARMNAIKICSEFQIFGILLACVVLQTHHQGDRIATEAIGLEDYGTAQVVLTLAIMPVTIYVLGLGLRDMRTQGADKPMTQAEEDAATDAAAEAGTLVVGDRVIWSDEDELIPRGSIGEIVEIRTDGKRIVAFANATKPIKPQNLSPITLEADQKSKKAKKGKKGKTDQKAKKAKKDQKDQKAKKKGKKNESTGTSEQFENPIAAFDDEDSGSSGSRPRSPLSPSFENEELRVEGTE